MARPRKHCFISCEVNATYFKPQGVPMRHLEEVVLDMDEVEAVRLADIEDMYHADAALKMGVSRPTFGNIIARAHKKIATALLEGKALRISADKQNFRLAHLVDTNNSSTFSERESMKPEIDVVDGIEQSLENSTESICGCSQKAENAVHECCGGANHEHGPGQGHGKGGGCRGGGGRGQCGRAG
ncbi:MAG: DUF134 domain-containing protein [Burkholderiaceae bacterium]|nr:DUF134 domain-containing protein [Burkholderiaceae bacterium]